MTLYAYNKTRVLTRVATFTTYRSAVEHGQQHFGYGNFHVDTGTRAPTREEQLLIEVKVGEPWLRKLNQRRLDLLAKL